MRKEDVCKSNKQRRGKREGTTERKGMRDILTS